MTASEAVRLLQQHNPLLDDLSWKAAGYGIGKSEFLAAHAAWHITDVDIVDDAPGI